MRTNTVTTENFSIDMIKALALMQHNGETFYIANGTAYTNEDYTEEVEQYEEDYNSKYMVLTDEEATEKTEEYIKDSLWAFNADFICNQIGLPILAAEMVASFCSNECENANDTILAMVENSADGLTGFIEAAISADGRGHFINSYDGNEHEETLNVDGENVTFYIYRQN